MISLKAQHPGSTKELFLPILSKKFVLGNDFLVYSPEKLVNLNKDINLKYGLTNTPKIVSGFSNNCRSLGENLYKK